MGALEEGALATVKDAAEKVQWVYNNTAAPRLWQYVGCDYG